MPDTTRTVPRQVWSAGPRSADTDLVVVESPVALVYNGISHVVMMATPADLEDFALGFSLSEGIIERPEQMLGVDLIQHDRGCEVAIEIVASSFAALKQRRRNLAGRTGCGLCGVESLDQLLLPSAPIESDLVISCGAIQRALAGLDQAQQIKNRTGGVHAAAWCSDEGEILLLREDVGRHNALDKVLGALCKQQGERNGFALVTSRASYEMVAKSVSCGVPILAAVSAPTDLAIEQAGNAGLTLVGFVQPGRHVVYTGGGRICE